MDKLLRQFIEVATFKNVSHAANRLCLSQPTLTHNMKKLEDNLGVQLLVRSSSGVTLTEYGELLLEQARMMQRIYDNTLIRMDLLKERQERSLKIGSGHAWWHMFLRETFEAHRHQYPTANVHIDLGNHLRLMDLLLSGDIDLFIGHEIQGLNPKAGVSFLPLLSSTDTCYARTGHPLRRRTVGQEELLAYPHVELTPDEPRYQHVMEDMQAKRRERLQLHMTERVVYSTNSVATAVDMLAATNGIMVFPSCMQDYFARFEVLPLRLKEPLRKGIVGIYLMREKGEDPHITQVIELMRRHMEQNRHLLE
ncbi:LysR family transcriptional regulator [Zobellella taiwanensis]|uniref:LysR family transcriptional regulator n=1 Tax=Zobellella taiwanensis TaxID=347535 RepID=A0A2P7RE56_9GAMM|nr:LysR family transcriptional regulator [Zobellella taiwanensis]PSJ48482.1 LysR family transcriptional regulator [Zobellella taiwanensis]